MIGNAALSLVAAALFAPLFLGRRLGWNADFWWWLSFDIAACTAAAAWRDPAFAAVLRRDLSAGLPRKLVLGAAAAAFLYLVFAAGNELSRLLFSWAGAGIDGVYSFKGGASSLRVGLLLALLIGPGEELFWRAGLQGRLERSRGPWPAFFLSTALYTGVHVASLNFMLIAAAAVCGAFWGLLYLRYRSPLVNVVSHTLWDISVFLLFPFS